MAQTLDGKVAIVTGGSKGLGAQIAKELACRGAKVVITFTSPNSEKGVDEIIEHISALKNGSKAIKVKADLRDLDAPEQIVKETCRAFGDSIDILVNNAGYQVTKTLAENTPEDYAATFGLNVRAVILLSKAVLLHLRSPGRIINMSSVGARAGFAELSLYCSSKAALEGLTRSLAAELGPAGHTVNAVNPGPVPTDLLSGVPQQIIDFQKSTTPMQYRLGTPDDVAQIWGQNPLFENLLFAAMNAMRLSKKREKILRGEYLADIDSSSDEDSGKEEEEDVKPSMDQAKVRSSISPSMIFSYYLEMPAITEDQPRKEQDAQEPILTTCYPSPQPCSRRSSTTLPSFGHHEALRNRNNVPDKVRPGSFTKKVRNFTQRRIAGIMRSPSVRSVAPSLIGKKSPSASSGERTFEDNRLHPGKENVSEDNPSPYGAASVFEKGDAPRITSPDLSNGETLWPGPLLPSKVYNPLVIVARSESVTEGLGRKHADEGDACQRPRDNEEERL
ncbi:uncharacterized protein KY384_006162 [Bacidia gigantensis]|uniref:uncharacterized protein n=1 Tax=Bacidia gigantensis TaxID=2732470 RepID=UPI001D058645|nr:uncharacterized protein KY384_006162 [Bacidia gigantensis]KAG8529525.1 hypothetical protein KY384_006162 [Bacidia gigantensis]